MRRAAVLLLSAIILTGCGKPTLDGSSNEALQKSIVKVVAGMSDEEKNQFKENFSVVAMTNLDLRAIFAGQTTTELSKLNLLSSLDGKTADEIGVEANRILLERAQKQHDEAVAEINALMEKQKNAQIAKNYLSKFSVTKSAFYMKKDKYYVKPYIDLSVTNGTDKAISRVYFIGTIASPRPPGALVYRALQLRDQWRPAARRKRELDIGNEHVQRLGQDSGTSWRLLYRRGLQNRWC